MATGFRVSRLGFAVKGFRAFGFAGLKASVAFDRAFGVYWGSVESGGLDFQKRRVSGTSVEGTLRKVS